MLPHGANPDHSSLEVMIQAQYDVSSDSNVQNLLCHKNIVITDHPVPKLSFDEDGLEVLNMTMEEVTTIWGMASYMAKKDLSQDKLIDALEDHNLCYVQGTLQKLLNSTKIVPPSRARIFSPVSHLSLILQIYE